MTRADLQKLIAAALERARRALPGENDEATADLILHDLRAAGVRWQHSGHYGAAAGREREQSEKLDSAAPQVGQNSREHEKS